MLQGKLAEQAAAHAAELQSVRESEAAAQAARDAAHAAELAKLEDRRAETQAELERERKTVERLNNELADLEVQSSMQREQERARFEEQRARGAATRVAHGRERGYDAAALQCLQRSLANAEHDVHVSGMQAAEALSEVGCGALEIIEMRTDRDAAQTDRDELRGNLSALHGEKDHQQASYTIALQVCVRQARRRLQEKLEDMEARHEAEMATARQAETAALEFLRAEEDAARAALAAEHEAELARQIGDAQRSAEEQASHRARIVSQFERGMRAVKAEQGSRLMQLHARAHKKTTDLQRKVRAALEERTTELTRRATDAEGRANGFLRQLDEATLCCEEATDALEEAARATAEAEVGAQLNHAAQAIHELRAKAGAAADEAAEMRATIGAQEEAIAQGEAALAAELDRGEVELQLLGEEAAAIEGAFRSSKQEQGATSGALARERQERSDEKRKFLQALAEIKAELAATKKELKGSMGVRATPTSPRLAAPRRDCPSPVAPRAVPRLLSPSHPLTPKENRRR